MLRPRHGAFHEEADGIQDGSMHRVEKPRGITRDYISGIRFRSLASGIRPYATVPD
jgi:hypothetical protein